jgi:hypothetical protein
MPVKYGVSFTVFQSWDNIAYFDDRPTSSLARGIISSSYASTASLRDFAPDATDLSASTIRAASWKALFRPCAWTKRLSAFKVGDDKEARNAHRVA